MRLTSIKLAGFKSFVDPSVLPLPSNLTAVVGPNGCGKSNIIDAVRWVLGESSMKQLRSETMEDVIFNGSKTRKPAGRASIELRFDNSDGQIQGPYAAYSEILVRRELSRDGNSQYLLNGAKCLKRDVTDLFLGTGLGARTGYAIIEQGMVSNMIQAKPEELRVWIEEAAGISRYKERRKETESRIRQTRENLARLNDLRSELQARLNALQKQSANAEKYKAFKTEERQLRAQHLALRLRGLDAQCQEQEQGLETLRGIVDGAKSSLEQAHQMQAAAEQSARELGQTLSAQQNKVYEAEAALGRQEQTLEHAKELKALKARDVAQIAAQLESLIARESAEQSRLQELKQSLTELDAQVATAAAAESEIAEASRAAEQALQAVQARWDDFSQRAEGPLFQAEGDRVRVEQLDRSVSEVRERMGLLEAECASMNVAPLQSSLFDADTELKALDQQLQSGQGQLESLDGKISTLRDERASEDGALHQARESLQSARGRMSSLETLQQAALQQDDAALQAWLRERGYDSAPRLASVIRVDRGWEAAVEHVLDGLLQAPVLPELQVAAALAPPLPKSGVCLVAQAAADSAARNDRLSSKVQGPKAILDLLESVRIAHSGSAAQEQVAGLAPGESLVTADGSWYGRGWLRVPRADEDQGSVLGRGVLLDELRTETRTHSEAVQRHESAVARIKAELAQLEEQRRSLATQFDAGRSRHAQRLAFRQAQAVRLEQTEDRGQRLQQELAALGKTLAEQNQEQSAARLRLSEIEAVAAKLKAERNEVQQALLQQRDTLHSARTQLAEQQAARNQAEVELAGRRSTLAALQSTLEDLGSRRQALTVQRSTQEQEALALEAPIASQAGAMEQARAVVGEARDALRIAREALEAQEARVATQLQQTRDAEFAQDAAREKLQQAQLDFQGLSVRRQTLEDQILETGHARETLLAALDADATAEVWEEKIAALGRRIERLGPINLAAIQELEEAQARESYLGGQNDDLSSALDTLEAAIKKIDTETRARFKETFDQVNTIFQDRFPKLFGGGEATLELTGENMLETGVRVMARPPGKRNSSIQLLSGGEKAMTAVALLLALFQLNPAPFCLLDEVDAPLDDANVSRFVDVIREMSSAVQFIIITHNKITMELAEQLHGVTMQEPGVSRMVSVDIQQAVDLAVEREGAVTETLAT